MLKEFLDRVRPAFQKGGKLAWFEPAFDATDTFLYTSPTVTEKGVHIRDALDSKRFMALVIVALLPTVFMGAWNVGYQHLIAVGEPAGFVASMANGLETIVPIVAVSYAVGGLWEGLFAFVRRHEINEGFLVTGLLFPLTLPPTIPLWQVALGISFGVVIGKEVFGGTGMNIFNPALVGRAFVFFAFPIHMSGSVWATVDYSKGVDGITGATPLLMVATGQPGVGATEILAGVARQFPLMDYSWWSLFAGFVPGSIGETSALACLFGAALLLATGIASWRTMAGVVLGGWIMSLIMNAFAGPGRGAMLSMPFHWHLVAGGFLFGCVYMATDPVSSCATDTGRWMYGTAIGMLAILIRAVNPAYPEGMMLAILFMNAFAPTFDYILVRANIKKRKLAHAK